MSIPPDLSYTPEHEWVRPSGHLMTIGITRYAADALGDVVYVELPAPGTIVAAGQPVGEIESTKSVSDLLAPADGEVVESNAAVMDNPALVNADPYGAGWLVTLRPESHVELLDDQEYRALTDGGSS